MNFIKLSVLVVLFSPAVAMGQETKTPALEKKEDASKVGARDAMIKAASTPCSKAPDGMSCVTGGLFQRVHSKGKVASSKALKLPATIITSFYMDKTEVTYRAYMACVKSRKCPKNGAGPRYRGYNAPKQPIAGVSWHDAVHYCKAQGKQLPTEAQWAYAARGPSGQLNPWGNEKATCKLAIIKDSRGRSCGVKKPGIKPEAGRLWKVASRPAGRYGLYDMVGNVQEWVLDWYSPSLKTCGAACAGLDPKGPCDGARRCKKHNKRVLKGGSWYWPASHATGIHRRANVPSNKPFHHFGFRCAATLAQGKKLMTQTKKNK